MARPDNRYGLDPAKLKKLQKLARATAKLSVEILKDVVNSGHSVPTPPKPKRGMMVMHSIPIPPKPKIETLVDLAYGAKTVDVSAEALETGQ